MVSHPWTERQPPAAQVYRRIPPASWKRERNSRTHPGFPRPIYLAKSWTIWQVLMEIVIAEVVLGIVYGMAYPFCIAWMQFWGILLGCAASIILVSANLRLTSKSFNRHLTVGGHWNDSGDSGHPDLASPNIQVLFTKRRKNNPDN